jgi:hypothetical protein
MTGESLVFYGVEMESTFASP